jgi:anti-sigma regulatory factor (Ser/Thr protein kinase)
MDRKCDCVRLIVPQKLAFLPIISRNANGMAKMLGFSLEEISEIELGVEEAVTNAIKHAFDPDETGIEVIFQPADLGIEIIVKDHGIPFDPKSVPSYRLSKKNLESTGLGIHLMRHLFDHVSFLNLGKDGKETRLVKYARCRHINEYAAHEMPNAPTDRDAACPPAIREVRLMQPGEAVAVSRCAYRAYRYSYIYEHIYHPERVRKLNRTGKLISYVVVSDAGEVVGHAALIPQAGKKEICEMGVAFVIPECRGGGVLNQLTQILLQDVHARGFKGAFVHAVTSHPFSQRAAHREGFRDTCILLSCCAPLDFKRIREDGHPHRESLIHSFLYCRKPASPIIYPPARHEEIVRLIYRNLGVEPRIGGDTGIKTKSRGKGMIRVHTDNNSSSHIHILQFARNTCSEVRSILRQLCLRRVETIFLFINLCDPCAAGAGEFEEMGFFFSGIFPGNGTDETLVLQYLNNATVDYGLFQMNSEMGKRILDYIKAMDPNQNL